MESLIKTPKHYLFSNKALFVLFLPLLIEQGLEFFVGFADSVMVASLVHHKKKIKLLLQITT